MYINFKVIVINLPDYKLNNYVILSKHLYKFLKISYAVPKKISTRTFFTKINVTAHSFFKLVV